MHLLSPVIVASALLASPASAEPPTPRPTQTLAPPASATPTYQTIGEAIAKGDITDVRRHLASNPQCLNNQPGNHSRSPLELAVLRNKTEIALLLIQSGALTHCVDASKRTPLHLAVERNNPVVAAALLKAGAQPNERDKDGWTPLHHAAAKNQIQTATVILAGGANPMTLSALGGTPLHEAAASGSAEIARLFLAYHVDPTIQSHDHQTALDIAKKAKNQPVIDVLSGL